MAIPTWVTGQVLTASDVNSWFVPLAAFKTGNTARNNTTAATADPDLTLTVAANATYRVEMLLFYQGGATGSSDLKVGWAGPSGATFTWGAVFTQISGLSPAVSQQQAISATIGAGTNTLSNQYHVNVRGLLAVASTAGSFALSWAQATSSGTNTSTLAGSYLIANRIS